MSHISALGNYLRKLVSESFAFVVLHVDELVGELQHIQEDPDGHTGRALFTEEEKENKLEINAASLISISRRRYRQSKRRV